MPDSKQKVADQLVLVSFSATFAGIAHSTSAQVLLSITAAKYLNPFIVLSQQGYKDFVMNVQKLIEQCQTTTESENLKIERLRAQTQEKVAEETRRTEEARTEAKRLDNRARNIELAVQYCREMLPELLRGT